MVAAAHPVPVLMAPVATGMHPAVRHPVVAGTRHNPVPANPYVMIAMPRPIARRPHVPVARRRRVFDDRRGRRNADPDANRNIDARERRRHGRRARRQTQADYSALKVHTAPRSSSINDRELRIAFAAIAVITAVVRPWT